MNTPVLLSCHEVGVRLGAVQALQGMNWSIHQGEAVALVGANGSGKSTLLRLMQGLIKPTQGSVYQADVGAQALVFQRPWMLRTSVLGNVALAAWLRGLRWRDAKEAAMLALQQVDLADLASRSARALSGGQQQRLGIARALVAQPQLLLLDEPTASLAPAAKRELESLMATLKARGISLVFASHNLGQVKRLATRVIGLSEGRVVFDGPVSDFFSQALHDKQGLTAAQLLEGQ
jgi:tungstate transport system ATP-binding protein